MTEKLETLLDHGTDIAGIAAIAGIAVLGAASAEVIGAIATIAIGNKYLGYRRRSENGADQ